MPRKPRKPGAAFWIWTFVIGVFSSGKGKRRINAKMTELYDAIKERDSRNAVQESNNASLTSENTYLREELQRQVEANRQLLVACEMDTALNTPRPVRNQENADDKVDAATTPVASTT